MSKTADEVLIYSTLATIIILTIAIFLAYVITTVLIRQITTLNNAIAKVADGDLTTTVDLDGKDELSNSMKLINQMIYVLNDTLTEVIRASEKVSTASLEFEKSSERMSYGAMEQTSSIEEISTAMEEMATTIQKNATNSVSTEDIVKNAVVGVEDSDKSVNQSSVYMKDILPKSQLLMR